MSAETLRKWVVQAQVDQGSRPGPSSEELAEIKRLKALLRERRTRDAEGVFVCEGPRVIEAALDHRVELLDCFVGCVERALELNVDRLAELISDLRDLYYDSLRGRRGRPITVETQPPVTISVLHHGTQLYFALAQETEGNGTHLSFPASEVPIFLDAARAALGTLQGAARG